jgi:hypothetical protein
MMFGPRLARVFGLWSVANVMTPEPPAAPPKPILSSWQIEENRVGNVPLIIVNGLFTVNA